jgi:hypothetical protein
MNKSEKQADKWEKMSEPLKNKTMSDKEALQEIVFMTNNYVNNRNTLINIDQQNYEFINDLIKFLEENVVHCAMDI